MALGLVVPASASAADLTSPETLKVDTYLNDNSAKFTPAQSTVGTLAANKFYVAEVTGTWSAFIPSYMSTSPPPSSHVVVCGTPEDTPAEPTPARPTSRVGQDAEIIFARPERGSCSRPIPVAYQGFQINLAGAAGTFAHLPVSGGPLTTPQAGHHYNYLLKGTGQVASFRMKDFFLGDNNGILTVLVRPAVPADCGTNPDCLGSTSSPP